MFPNLIDRIAARLAIWALRRLYGADCPTNIKEDFPDDPDIQCISCDATQMVAHLQEILEN